ncbi:hypothetical protein HFO41_10895 [Rhizobium leguminosarum]|uniref:hypothetical protein n=1 Tax=Rhizobium leguminosarum TaxID=384 RepID=UPI001C9851F6|nr:hypothetical protein [Rhizobium leguminosarum]MBY5689330.1 hypothetical protein [Rhizobium leguminosarum]
MVSARTKINKRRVASYIGAGVIGGGGSSGQTANILAANRGQFPTNVALIPDDTVSARDVWFSPEGDVTNPVVHHVNTYINGSFALVTGSAATFSAYLEYPLGTFTQLTYNGGSLTYVLSSGVVSSDPVPGLTGLVGTKARVHTRCHSGGSAVACIELPANADTIGVGDAKYAWAGAPAYPGAAQASTLFFGANAITGTVAKTGARAFGIPGHSIPFGQGDISSSGVKGGSGHIARGLDSSYPYAKFCKGGMSTTDMAALRTSGTLANLIKLCNFTDVIQDYTGGDLRIGNTVAAIKDAIQTVFGMFGNAKRFYQVTALDRTDSTDSYATVVNQTPKTDGNWINQIPLNTDIRAGLPRVTAVLDICAWSSSSFNSGVWNGSPARTTDGVHPNSFEAARLGALVAAFTFTIPAPAGSWLPSDLGSALTAAYDTNDVNQVTDDGAGNLVRMRASYGGGDILPGSSPDVSLTGGVASNKRVITFAAGEYLQSVDARILLAGNGVVASGKVTVIEAMKFVAATTSRGFMFGSIGGTSGAPSIGIRQTTTNRGPSVTPVSGGTAYTAFQASFDGNWHVHTVTVDGLNIVYRVDGVQVATGTIVGGTSFSFSQFLIGAIVGAVAGTPGGVNPLSAHAGMLIADDALSGAALTSAEAWVGATAGL